MTNNVDSNYWLLNMISTVIPLPFGKSKSRQLLSQTGFSIASAIFETWLWLHQNEKPLLFKRHYYESKRQITDSYPSLKKHFNNLWCQKKVFHSMNSSFMLISRCITIVFLPSLSYYFLSSILVIVLYLFSYVTNIYWAWSVCQALF